MCRVCSTLALEPGNSDYRAMNKIVPAVSRDANHRISRRAALGLGATVAAGVLLSPPGLTAAPANLKVVVWSEGTANVDPGSKAVYPNDINTAIAEGLQPLAASGWEIVKAGLNDPDQGISDALLNSTDVLIWWGHKKHGDVKDQLVDQIVKRVKEGNMGFIATHSSHFCKPLKALLGTACSWGNTKRMAPQSRSSSRNPGIRSAKG